MEQNRTIRIVHFGREGLVETTPEAMAAMAGATFPLRERVEEGAGEAFDFAAWYEAWRGQNGIAERAAYPTHLKVEAEDTFEAVIPWHQLANAAVQYATDGKPLAKGGPIRLYVPNGTSACLNVKSIVTIRFISDTVNPEHVSYGFKNSFSPQELLKKV